jgi:hypothetical protein
MRMGFTEERVIRALRVSFDDPDRAIELLLNVRPFSPSHLKLDHGT